jgi:hypothetical protein
MEEAQKLIEENDSELKAREDELIQQVNGAYEKAVKEAVKEFTYLSKLNPNIKPSSAQVKKIVENVMDGFGKEFNKLAEPFRKELLLQYEKGLKEASLLLAIRDEKNGKPA